MVGWIALTGALLLPWIRGSIELPGVEEKEKKHSTVVTLGEQKDPLLSFTFRKQEEPEPESEPKEKQKTQYLYMGVIGLGMIGSACGLASLIRGEERRISETALLLGLSAAMFHYLLWVIAILLLIWIVSHFFAGMASS